MDFSFSLISVCCLKVSDFKSRFEFSKLECYVYHNIYMGFHRLAINGLNEKSNQPMKINDSAILICNGEIYNYKELYKMMNDIVPKTGSDCEVIIYLYRKYGIEHAIKMLDGVFAFVLYDYQYNMIERLPHMMPFQ